jgi:hypothetical protein
VSIVRPLPGIFFETRAKPLGDALPRMDIPVFVGFAASGPVHAPVAIEDVAQFAMIFGGDVELPSPRGASAPRYAHLAPCVRAFFRNGGRRCWVVRVAGAGAAANQFAIPGLFSVTPLRTASPVWPPAKIDQAYVRARSEGSWSDAIRVEASLVSHALKLQSYDHAAATGDGTIASPLGSQRGPVAIADIVVGSPREVVGGDLVRITWRGWNTSLYLFVASVAGAGTSGVVRLLGRPLWIAPSEASPPGASPGWVVVASPESLPETAPTAERLTFDLTVRGAEGRPLHLTSLGFTPEHPRYVGGLPTDGRLFEDASQFAEGATPRYRPLKRIAFSGNFTGSAQASPEGWPELWADAAQPRFPLAADPIDGAVYVPAGMSAFASESARARPASATALERDGLDRFSYRLFLDAELEPVAVGSPPDAGEGLTGIDDGRPDRRGTALRDLLDRADALRYREGRALQGIHGALGIEEATMLAVPDAVQHGWEGETAPEITAPVLPPEPRPEKCPPLCPTVFSDCAEPNPIAPPTLTASTPVDGTYDIEWTPEKDALDELQEAATHDFSDAATILVGNRSKLTIHGHAAGTYYYRIRRRSGGRVSAWSTTVVTVAGRLGYSGQEETSSDEPALRRVQAAMVRMCAARGDMVAILSLPRHFDGPSAIAHVTKLSALVEKEALSYGALWHPWPIARDDSGPPSAIPPDGVTAGVMAARAASRGAWVAPANEPLRGVVALTPAIPPDARQALQDAAVNLIRHEPAGFVCLDADTLSAEADVRPLNVRRLLVLVRRAAIRVGNDYAFEPNSPSLRNAIKRGFEAILAGMFLRGAFAGRTAQSSYQVVTDETVNSQQSVEAGRLIAEIRIAPSRPLSFLTIRLVQLGEATVAQEVR